MGELAIPSAGTVYIDANTVIYAVERMAPYALLLQPLWEAAQAKKISIVTSELTWLETLTKPLREQDAQLAGLFREFLTADEVTLLPATLTLWEQAARLRALGLKTPDALHAATALASSSRLFVTNDRAFQRVSELPVAVLHTLIET